MSAQADQHLETEVLIVGSGGAGMYAAIAAARAGAQVVLLDRSLVGRSGATVMAQMTVAAAIGHAEPDEPARHLEDTLAAGRGLSNEALARALCEDAPARILEMADWNVGWAAEGNRIRQVTAPGHSVSRCVYVDFLNTGPAVSRALRNQVNRHDGVRRVSDLAVTDVIVDEGRVIGAVARHLPSGAAVTIAAKAVILATGGLTRLYHRNSASANMGGDGHALALRAGAELVDMEFVQFFPIGHLAPRLIGMDPIMWDPFRYKLGGRLLNGDGVEFTQNYGVAEDGRYRATRDVATYAILKEVEAGRGSPHGGAYLSFEHVAAAELRQAFGPVIDRLAGNDIDLTKRPIEVAPIAHYHMGGVVVDESMQSGVPGLYAAGEVVGGPSGANRLSGNGVTEAFVFGERAGRFAAERSRGRSLGWRPTAAAPALARLNAPGRPGDERPSATALIAELQALMDHDVGPFRTEDKLARGLARIREIRGLLPEIRPAARGAFDPALADWFDLDNMSLIAESIALTARARLESRGAHQREDFPDSDPDWICNQRVALEAGEIRIERTAVDREK
ncbi:MAG: FAD-binding protein [Alphaproteobacteria bacterium]|jgi:succinate dehydrogenase/fumarate reductase flavoprotein subunit|nr:FAD-binding protein [Alphaproteobacteria bacterium]